jgi:hypothetical protein
LALNNPSNQVILGSTTLNASITTSRTYSIPDAGGAASFVMMEGVQIVNGTKTFGSRASFADGNTANPSISVTNDANTGLYRIGNDNVGISPNDVLSMNMSHVGIHRTKFHHITMSMLNWSLIMLQDQYLKQH